MEKTVVIIDADSICYIGGKEDSLSTIIDNVNLKVEEILRETNADFYLMVVSKGRYFRHEVSKMSYKSNRKYDVQPWVKVIKEYLCVEHKAINFPNVEADDICSLLMGLPLAYNELIDNISVGEGEPVKKILVAKDKDLLQSIPGKHLNFSKKLSENEWGMEWIETSEGEADEFVRSQMIIGDASDCISGLYRKGVAYWKKISAEVIPSWGDILQLYIADYGESKGIYEFQKNYRLLHMLSSYDDFEREVGYIPELPIFQRAVL